MIIERLYRGEEIPEKTDYNKVRQVREHLFELLVVEMKKRHIWLAACTVAVEAGIHTGNRKRKRRRKLLSLINVCNRFLGEDEIVMPDRWESTGIYDGYGAIHKFNKDTGISSDDCILMGLFAARLIS